MGRMVKAGFALTGAIVALGPALLPLQAQEKKQEYVPKVELTKLVEEPLAGSEGRTVHIVHAKLPPGYVGGKHYHSGPVFVYVLDGALTIEEEGKPARTFTKGQVYEEPLGQTMQGFNKNASEATELLIIQVQSEGVPLMVKVE